MRGVRWKVGRIWTGNFSINYPLVLYSLYSSALFTSDREGRSSGLPDPDSPGQWRWEWRHDDCELGREVVAPRRGFWQWRWRCCAVGNWPPVSDERIDRRYCCQYRWYCSVTRLMERLTDLPPLPSSTTPWLPRIYDLGLLLSRTHKHILTSSKKNIYCGWRRWRIFFPYK